MAIIGAVEARPGPRPPRRGGHVASWVIAAGLIAVIVVAMGTSIYMWRNAGDPPARMERAARPIHFRCERCGYEFDMIPTDFHQQWRDVNPSLLPPGSRQKAHCPKCNQKYCAKMLDDRLSDEERQRIVPRQAYPATSQP